MFSKRTSCFDGIPNALHRAREAAAHVGDSICDLVTTDPGAAGIHYPPSLLKKGFARGAILAKRYRPHPQGQPEARSSIEQYYHEEGLSLSADQIVLTPGTSVSYGYLFRMLADPGDEILCPTPTYPLFDGIAALCNVKITSYRLVPSHRWEIDFDHLRSKLSDKTRAIVLISPHNPTGAVADPKEIEWLTTIAATHRLPIIVDEVFRPFRFTRPDLPSPAAAGAPLVFTLNGVSKMLALPGVKIGWIGLSGEKKEVQKSLRRLTGIVDTDLPVNELAQFALPTLLEEGKPFMRRYRAWVARCCASAVTALRRSEALSFISPEGGFYITVKMHNLKSHDEAIALELLHREKILVYPGYFYDLPAQHLVFTFVTHQRSDPMQAIVQFLNRL